MDAHSTAIDGTYLIELDPHVDARGSFVRVFEEEDFRNLGLRTRFPHHNLAHNKRRGTLRGLHYQTPPWGEVKVVHCLQGAIFDVLVDIRPDSPTARTSETFHLSAQRPTLLYVPEGVAHGYQTLQDDSTIHYLMGAIYRPDQQRGIAWDEPLLGIEWPLPDPILSEKDRAHPPLDWSTAWPAPE